MSDVSTNLSQKNCRVNTGDPSNVWRLFQDMRAEKVGICRWGDSLNRGVIWANRSSSEHFLGSDSVPIM